ncbi:hypothetical protein HYW46_05805 [Candidatus Daviesbacteria bacterium]|nr:hypothetical protein [Candidatus Daviesbacteria bacterium]
MGEERLTFYSAFVLNAVIESLKHGLINQCIFFDDPSFGSFKKSTGELMLESLLRTKIASNKAILMSGNSNNTVSQIKVLGKFQEDFNLQSEKFLIIAWGFHIKRIKNYINSFKVNADIVSAESLHKIYRCNFNEAYLQKILPVKISQREKISELISRIDKQGQFLLFLKLFTGPMVTDIYKDDSGKLQDLITPGNKRLKQVQGIQKRF